MSDRKGRGVGVPRNEGVDTSRSRFAGTQASHLTKWFTTVLSDQVNNLFHDDIIIVIVESGHRPNKAANLGVDARLESSIGKVVHRRLNLVK